jgi:hypothetical protein
VGYVVRGIVGDVHDISRFRMPSPEAYFTYDSDVASRFREYSLAIRARAGEGVGESTVRRFFESVDPWQPVSNIARLELLIATELAERKMLSLCFVWCGLVALVLVVTGIFAVVSEYVTSRVREIAVRMAVGAAPAVVGRAVLCRGILLVWLGGGAGLLIAIGLSGPFGRYFPEIGRSDASIYLIVALLVSMVGLSAAAVPAARATRTDPARLLRCE